MARRWKLTQNIFFVLYNIFNHSVVYVWNRVYNCATTFVSHHIQCVWPSSSILSVLSPKLVVHGIIFLRVSQGMDFHMFFFIQGPHWNVWPRPSWSIDFIAYIPNNQYLWISSQFNWNKYGLCYQFINLSPIERNSISSLKIIPVHSKCFAQINNNNFAVIGQ